MFGNRNGWMIAVICVLVTVMVIWKLGKLEDPSPPTGQLAFALQPIELKVDPSTVVSPGTASGDAGAPYRNVIRLYKNNSDVYENFGLGKTEARPPKHGEMPAVDAVLDGRNCAKMTLFAANPDEIVNYKNSLPPLDALERVGNCTVTIGLLYKVKGDKSNAQRYFDAAFVLGRHLFNERLTFREYYIGRGLMHDVALNMQEMYKDRADAIADFISSLDNLSKDHSVSNIIQFGDNKCFELISGIGDNTIVPHAGDMFDIALHSKEPMWRTEAILKLGRYRYNAGGDDYVNNRLASIRVVKKLALDPSLPASVRTAAVTARDLTIEDYRKIGGSA